MTEKNDDIKNLFLNLGLNPSDYHEIRTAPSANATVSEAPRRWSLLQAASATQPAAASAMPPPQLSALNLPSPQPAFAASAAPLTAQPVSVRLPPITAPVSEPVTSSNISQNMAAALFAAATDIVRVEAGEPVSKASQPSPAPLPSSGSTDGLQSLFQSVKEPQTVSMLPESFMKPAATAHRDERLQGRQPPVTRPVERSDAPQAASLRSSHQAETRNEPASPPLSRLGPLPIPATSATPVPRPAAGEGRLRFATLSTEPVAEVANGDSLRHVFARLSRENRR